MTEDHGDSVTWAAVTGLSRAEGLQFVAQLKGELAAKPSWDALHDFAFREGNRRLVAHPDDALGRAWVRLMTALEVRRYGAGAVLDVDALERFANGG